MKKERFPEITIPDMDTRPRSTEIAGFNLICAFSENARNGFYTVIEQNDDCAYVYPTVFGRELPLKEIRFFWGDSVTMADFFPQWVRDFIAYSYAMNSNPLPAIRNRFPEFDFVFWEEVIDRPDAPLPKEGATILVDRQGNMASQPDEPQPVYEVEADDPVEMEQVMPPPWG
jgi:hypothetical protein